MEISKRQHGFYALARRAMFQSNLRIRVGSVLVRGSRVIGVGCNADTGSPFLIRNSNYWSIHAEISVVLGFDANEIRGCHIYNWRETKSGDMACSAPCALCVQKLSQLGIDKVWYTNKGNGYGVISL